MRNTRLVYAALVLIAGIVSASLWLELRAERQLTASLGIRLEEAKRPSSVARPAGPLVAAAPQLVNAAAADSDNKTDTAPLEGKVPRQPVGKNGESGLARSPEYRNAYLAQQRLSFARNLPGVAEELNLSDTDADRLFDLLAEFRLKMESASSQPIRSADGQIDRAAIQDRQQELQRQQEQSIAALLGTDKYTRWQDYKQTIRVRNQAISLGTQLAQMGQPLGDSQQKFLTTAFLAEQKRFEEQAQMMYSNNMNRTDPQAIAQFQEQITNLQEQSNRRFLNAVGPRLNSRQVEALRKQFEAQAAMERATSSLQRTR